jgi:hypothetical protein
MHSMAMHTPLSQLHAAVQFDENQRSRLHCMLFCRSGRCSHVKHAEATVREGAAREGVLSDRSLSLRCVHHACSFNPLGMQRTCANLVPTHPCMHPPTCRVHDVGLSVEPLNSSLHVRCHPGSGSQNDLPMLEGTHASAIAAAHNRTCPEIDITATVIVMMESGNFKFFKFEFFKNNDLSFRSS